MENKSLLDSLDRLWYDYLELCESYQNELEVYEFGHAVIRMASKMLFDTAPSQSVAYKTILSGIEEGFKEHNLSMKNKLDSQ